MAESDHLQARRFDSAGNKSYWPAIRASFLARLLDLALRRDCVDDGVEVFRMNKDYRSARRGVATKMARLMLRHADF